MYTDSSLHWSWQDFSLAMLWCEDRFLQEGDNPLVDRVMLEQLAGPARRYEVPSGTACLLCIHRVGEGPLGTFTPFPNPPIPKEKVPEEQTPISSVLRLSFLLAIERRNKENISPSGSLCSHISQPQPCMGSCN